MPPKKVYVQPASSRRQPKGFFASTYDSLTSPENSSMVKAIASFGVSFDILLQCFHSLVSRSEY